MNLIDKSVPASPAPAGPELKRVQTLEDLSRDQVRAIRQIPGHDEARPRAIDARRPVSIFLDQERYEREQANVFRKFAVPVTVSARLPRNGSVIAHDSYGVPLLISRDTEGRVRAFLNACTRIRDPNWSKIVRRISPRN